jgi:GST-like protein
MAQAGHDFIAGDYSIADMACYPWVVPHERQQQKLQDFPHLAAWFERIRGRPGTERAYARAQEVNAVPVVDEASRKVLFGQDAAPILPAP